MAVTTPKLQLTKTTSSLKKPTSLNKPNNEITIDDLELYFPKNTKDPNNISRADSKEDSKDKPTPSHGPIPIHDPILFQKFMAWSQELPSGARTFIQANDQDMIQQCTFIQANEQDMTQQYRSELFTAINQNNLEQVQDLLSLDNQNDEPKPMTAPFQNKLHFDCPTILFTPQYNNKLTPLMLAIFRRNTKIIQYLLNFKYNANNSSENMQTATKEQLLVKNHLGFNAIMFAASLGYNEIVTMLIEAAKENGCAGKMLRAQNQKGANALLVAMISNKLDTAELLLQTEPQAQLVKMKDGNTALLMAARLGYRNIALTILPHATLDYVLSTQIDDNLERSLTAMQYASVRVHGKELSAANKNTSVQNPPITPFKAAPGDVEIYRMLFRVHAYFGIGPDARPENTPLYNYDISNPKSGVKVESMKVESKAEVKADSHAESKADSKTDIEMSTEMNTQMNTQMSTQMNTQMNTQISNQMNEAVPMTDVPAEQSQAVQLVTAPPVNGSHVVVNQVLPAQALTVTVGQKRPLDLSHTNGATDGGNGDDGHEQPLKKPRTQ